MTAGELMTRTFEVVHPDALIEHVAARLAAPEAEPLLVCEHGRLTGVLDRDDVARANGAAGGARRLRVRDVVAPDVLYCLEGTDLVEAAALMRESRARVIPVLSADRRPVGVVRLADVPDEDRAPHAESGSPRGADPA